MFWRFCPCFRTSNEFLATDLDDGKVLDFGHSRLEDVPNEVFHKERTLEELYLDSNQIHDLPRQLFHCNGLKILNLCDNDIQTIPTAISTLTNLEVINLSKNGVLDFPDNIRSCKCLRSIDVSVNPLGKLPDGFTQLINLQELYLNDTFLEFLPANFGRLIHLKILELRENHLKTLPKSLLRLTELHRLDIGQNELMELPEVIGSLTNLTELWCDSNRLISIPPFIGNLTRLTNLDVSNNRIVDVADELGFCLSMTDLTMSLNKIPLIPEMICNLKQLVTLRIDENDLEQLPFAIGSLTSLTDLVINQNLIETIPASIGFLRNLQTVIADSNKIQELPASIGSCNKLRLLSLSDNFLSKLPDEIGRLSSLKVLNLSRNKLQSLPVSLTKITQLQSLWLSENQQKPIMKLQPDTDKAGRKILTCFLLPQQPLDDVYKPASSDEDSAEHIKRESPNEERHAIKFANENGENLSEEDEIKDKVLLRNPTPYPKELKAHARHARNLALQKQNDCKPDVIESIDIEEGDLEMVMPTNVQSNPAHPVGDSGNFQVRNAVLQQAPNDADKRDAHLQQNFSEHPKSSADLQASANPAQSEFGICSSESRYSNGNGNGNDGFHIKRIENTQPFYQEAAYTEQRASLQGTEGYRNTQEHYHNRSQIDNSIMMNEYPIAENDYSMFVNVNDSALSNNYYAAENTLYKASAAIVHNDTTGDIALADSFSSITSVYPSSIENESDRARSSASYSSPIRIIAKHGVVGHLQHPSLQTNSRTNGQQYNQIQSARPDIHNSPSKVTIHELENQVHSYKPRFVARNAPDDIMVRQIGSSCEKIRETTSDECSSQSSATSFMNQSNSQFRSQTHTFPVIIVKNSDEDLGFVIEGGVDQMHSHDASIFVSNVIECGPASTALKIGDRIIRVDEIDLCNVTNETAKAILQSTGPTVSLLVSRTACYV